MPPMTLNQAAKACGRSKSTLLEAIKTGRLSAYRNDINQWEIQPAELFRVYPIRSETEQSNTSRTPKTEQSNSEPTTKPNTQNGLLFLLKKEQVERDRERKQLEETIADLRKRLDASEAERRQLMLTHQPEPVNAVPTAHVESKLLLKLFGKNGRSK